MALENDKKIDNSDELENKAENQEKLVKGDENDGKCCSSSDTGGKCCTCGIGDSQDQGAEAGAGETIKKEDEVEILKTLLNRKDSDIKGWEDKFLRLQAEFINYKRINEKEKEALVKYSNERIICELVNVIDDLDMAVSHAGSSSVEQGKGIVEGVELTRKRFLDLMKKFGVEVIPAAGERFNPEFHQAMMQAKNENLEDGFIDLEIRKGYTLNGRVIRPSMVSVVKNEKTSCGCESGHGHNEANKEKTGGCSGGCSC